MQDVTGQLLPHPAFSISVRPEGERGEWQHSMTANLQTDDVSAIGGGAGVPSGDFLDEATALFREAAGELFGALRGLRRGRTEEAKAAGGQGPETGA